MSDPDSQDTQKQLQLVVAELRSLRRTVFWSMAGLAAVITVLTFGVVYGFANSFQGLMDGFDKIVVGCLAALLATIVVLMFSFRPK